MTEVGKPCPKCGAKTIAVGAYWPSTQDGPDSYALSCSDDACGWSSEDRKQR